MSPIPLTGKISLATFSTVLLVTVSEEIWSVVTDRHVKGAIE
ncbi:hypothetical protein Bsph_0790 [Lysinibacillus sphaericus C3-41]|uniref:Uncharacterized protein n=1 Tax=Lysinibacillus sphaericus (strain C3-41) TaxID=444177 RepID=B1HZ06_LYSSC|nr:hypothetical protein Bsph_0790 [Lysinibacillus sphaericus C3-41]